jgi:NADH:ubiquinone oxidoreductase subunit 5 (subunit L)/multisubunit Na+/H+ antiporter MnhA subunit
VGFAYVVGFGLAIFIYRRGLGMGDRLRRVFAPVHLVLERKFFFDEVYNVFLVGGCKVVAKISALFDTYFVDLIVNLVARLIERLGSFSGWVVDARGIDGVANGLANGAWRLAGLLRRPQTGRIRNYVLFAAGGTAVLLFVMLAVR